MNTRIVLRQGPQGWANAACFGVEQVAEPKCGAGDVLLQALYLSNAPCLRGRVNAGPSYAPGYELGRPIVSRVVARVLEGEAIGKRLVQAAPP